MNPRCRYASDLTEREWAVLESFLSKAYPRGRGRVRERTLGEIMNGIFYVLRSGCSWRMMPTDLPR